MFPVLMPHVGPDQYMHLDLSVNNAALADINTGDPDTLAAYIKSLLKEHNALLAYGGYNEKRAIYRRSTVFKNDQTEERDIHIGIDLWADAGEVVYAPLDAVVHSLQYNNRVGDYGPTIILKHETPTMTFHTLYGHLSLDSLDNLKPGDIITEGQPFATLGDASVNGDYAPHLHWQMIIDMEGKTGDYPGVCSASTLDYYLRNCPNVMLMMSYE